MATFTVTVADDALAVQLRKVKGVQPDVYVQSLMDAAFEVSATQAHSEKDAAIVVAYNAAGTVVQTQVDGILKPVIVDGASLATAVVTL